MAVVETPTIAEQANSRWPEIVRFVLLVMAWGIAIGAALAPIVYLLRRIGVG
ncbi:MAG: hypothetical protein R2710_29230 [Acidimicrobiales bacterium]